VHLCDKLQYITDQDRSNYFETSGTMSRLVFLITVIALSALYHVPFSHGVMPGGWTKVSVNSDVVKNVSQFAVNALAKSSNSMYTTILVS